MNKWIVISCDIVFHENQFLDSSVFGNIEHSRHEFQISFDIMINEESEFVNYIISSHSLYSVYHSISLVIFTTLTISQTQSITSSIPSTSISYSSIYEFINMKSDFENLSIISIQSWFAFFVSDISSSELQ